MHCALVASSSLRLRDYKAEILWLPCTQIVCGNNHLARYPENGPSVGPGC